MDDIVGKLVCAYDDNGEEVVVFLLRRKTPPERSISGEITAAHPNRGDVYYRLWDDTVIKSNHDETKFTVVADGRTMTLAE